MLNNQYFYYQLTRKYVILFGNMFNNISIVRKNRDTGVEIERFKVPIVYAPKEKYFARLRADPDLDRPVQVILPRMSFELVGFNYDASRKQNSLLRSAKGNTATGVSSQYMGVPYDLNFELQLYSRNVDDGTHIIEQILPYFTPDYTVTIDSIPELGFLKDIPIILNSVNNVIEHEGNFDAVRFVSWTLGFTLKAYYYGPINNPKIIRRSITNIYNDPSLQSGNIVRINTISGNSGTFKLDDVVYQGTTYDTATAYGRVVNWNPYNGRIVIGGAQGQFKVNSVIKAISTNASYNVISFVAEPLLLANITIVPNPETAEPGDDYGYTTTITEYYSSEPRANNLPVETFTTDSINIQADSTTITTDKE